MAELVRVSYLIDALTYAQGRGLNPRLCRLFFLIGKAWSRMTLRENV